MPKTQFSNSELITLYRSLVLEKAFPIKRVGVYVNTLQSSYNRNLVEIDFWSENNKVHTFSVVTETTPKCEKLLKQLEQYFL